MGLSEALISAASGLSGVVLGGWLTKRAQDHAARSRAASAAHALNLDLARILEEMGESGSTNVQLLYTPTEPPKLHRWIEPLIQPLAERKPAIAHRFAVFEVMMRDWKERRDRLGLARHELQGARLQLEDAYRRETRADTLGDLGPDDIGVARRRLTEQTDRHEDTRAAFEALDAELRIFIDDIRANLHRVSAETSRKRLMP